MSAAKSVLSIATAALIVGTVSVTGSGVLTSVPPDAASIRFTASGDISSSANAATVLSQIPTLGSDLHLALGDLSYGATGTESTWCDFVTTRVGAGFPFELVSGNHESDGQNGNVNDFSACLPNQLPGVIGTYGREYYVDVPADAPLVRFVMISPGLHFPTGDWAYAAGDPHYVWTRTAIQDARADGVPWVVVGMHKPCLSMGFYPCDVGAALMNLLVSERVDLVLGGHEHIYQRSKQLAHGTGCTAVPVNAYDADCVADADSNHAKGAGTVFATVGTGGVALRETFPSDSEAPYFSAWSGTNAQPSWGNLAVDVTATTFSAQFAPASGAFTDAFTITDGPPPPNEPPVAAFAPTCAGLTCTFSSTESRDPDGTIAAYAWTFGDDTTATGPSPVKTYAAAGTYPVGLTVTDDDGAPSTTATATVTVTAVAALAADAFQRTSASGLGIADVGGAWTYAPASGASRFSVDGSTGVLTSPAGTFQANLTGVTTTRARLSVDFTVDKLVEAHYIALVGRQFGADQYIGRVRIAADGSAKLYILQNSNAVRPSFTVPGLLIQPGVRYTLSLEVVGTSPTTLSAKVWRTADPEPAAWQVSGPNTFAGLQRAGYVGMFSYLPSSAAVSFPVRIGFDDFRVVDPPTP